MHILVVNDDGPPSSQSSPYVHCLVHLLQSAGHIVSVVLPHRQRSWIGKAHLVGVTVKPTYFRPGTLHQNDGTIHHLPRGLDGDEAEGDEWILIDSTPASCVQIGLFHYFQDRGPVDLVISGPNYGRNTTAVFSLSSGTIGAAMEAAVCGRKSIALSYAFNSRVHDPVIIEEASNRSVRLIEHLYKNWGADVDLYNINVPLEAGVAESKILFTHVLDNRWTSGSCFEAIDAEMSGEGLNLQEQALQPHGEVDSMNGAAEGPLKSRHRHKHFKWSPNFSDLFRSMENSVSGNDGWAVKQGITSVTPLKANFWHLPGYKGEIKLPVSKPMFYALVDFEDSYVQPLLIQALKKRLQGIHYQSISSLAELPDPSAPVLQYRAYEKADFEHVLLHPSTSLVNSYIIRKALIRKHYLSNTVAAWITKHPGSVLRRHFKPAVDFELDYAEFLEEALADGYELRESFERNAGKLESEKEWWILKPGMSDGCQGIRLFNSEASLRQIFEEWDSTNGLGDDDDDDDGAKDYGIVASKLRHFIAQPYIHPPLLLPSASNKKFHIRTYVLAVGSLKVYVYREMLALFARKPYLPPWEGDGVEDLTRHLTNTCLQNDNTAIQKESNVCRFWALDDNLHSVRLGWKDSVYEQICAATGEVFEAAARGMLVHFQTLPNAFELFGVDFLVDEEGNAWLLELNAFPDFRQTGEELKCEVVGGLFEAVVDVGVKGFFNIQNDNSSNSMTHHGNQLDMQLVADLNLRAKT